MIEGLGPKLQQARLARGLTLDEAGRLTKIRPSKLAEIEAEDFSDFPSLAYARGFVQIYGKFLNVDVSGDLDAFETPDQMTVDGYSYLQESTEPQPPRRVRQAVTVRRDPSDRGSLLPLVIGIVVLVVGFMVLKFFLNVQRIKSHVEQPMNAATPAAASPAGQLVAPRALAADNTPVPVAKATPPSPPLPTTTPAVAVASAAPAVKASEPEVRRAEPVRAEELADTTSATPGAVNKIEIRPLKKTYLKVVVDGKSDAPAIERWVSASDKSLRVSGQRVVIHALDPSAVEIRKNGKKLPDDDPDVTVE
ncbi:MAG: helix-turn-helix domain-containing protein [Chthoniobacterales bacterium]